MLSVIENLIGINHLITSVILVSIASLIGYYFNSKQINQLVFKLILLNLSVYYIYLIYSGDFSYQNHLPLHLCYMTELLIFISLLFNNKILFSWLFLNSVLGAFVGLINSNLISSYHFLEFTHYYLSHFNLLLFSILAFKSNLALSKKHVFNSVAANSIIFIIIYNFNNIFNSNYWFTVSKPIGKNLSVLFPSWPYYLYLLILFGLTSYYLTFKIMRLRVQK